MRSNSGSGTAVVPTPTPAVVTTSVPGSTIVPAATIGVLPSRLPTTSGDPGPSGEPVVTPGPGTPTPEPSAVPSASTSPAPLVADTGFTCEAAGFDDPTKGSWRVTRAEWGARDRWDELTIVLGREAGRGRTDISVEAMSARDAARITGLDKARNDRVVLITFDGDVTRNTAIVERMGLRALDYLNIETTSQATYAVVGVERDGCFRMVAPAWKKGTETAVGDTMNLLLDVKYR